MKLGLGLKKQNATAPVCGMAPAVVETEFQDGPMAFYLRFYTQSNSAISLFKALGLSVASHGTLLLLVYVVLWIGFALRLWENLTPSKPKPADIEFVLVPKDVKAVPPANTQTRFRAEHAMKAGGKAPKLAERPVKPVEASTVLPKIGAVLDPVAQDKALEEVIEAQGPAAESQTPETVDALADTTMRPYMDELKTRIHAAWHPPRGNDTKRVVLRFRMKHEGTLDGVWIQDSSGESVTDSAAISAIEQTFPFRPLPDTIPDEKIDIEFTFDYNVFGDLPPSGENG